MKVTYINHMGDDLAVVNAARVSFNKKSKWVYCEGDEDQSYCGDKCEVTGTPCPRLTKSDEGLIGYLARGCTKKEWSSILIEAMSLGGRAAEFGDRNAELELESLLHKIRKMPTHFAPFATGTSVLLHFKTPLFVARQLQKSHIGAAISDSDISWSEESRRYVDYEPEVYCPEEWRLKAVNVKQGSSDKHLTEDSVGAGDGMQLDLDFYSDLVSSEVCPEQARMVLPQATYVQWQWKGSVLFWSRVYNLRSDPHTQKETREVAEMIREVVEPLYPVSWKELTR